MTNYSATIISLPIGLWNAAGEEDIDIIVENMQAIMDKREWPKYWCRVVFISLPKKGVFQLLHNKPHSTYPSNVLLKIFKGRISYTMAERWQNNRLVLWNEKELQWNLTLWSPH